MSGGTTVLSIPRYLYTVRMEVQNRWHCPTLLQSRAVCGTDWRALADLYRGPVAGLLIAGASDDSRASHAGDMRYVYADQLQH